MSKQIKKQSKKQKKISKYIRTCERCGNEQFRFEAEYKCKWCGYKNGNNDLEV